MGYRARACVGLLVFTLLFVGMGMAAGADKGLYDHGCGCVHRGWSGAWRVGGIAFACELIFLFMVALVEWVFRGDD